MTELGQSAKLSNGLSAPSDPEFTRRYLPELEQLESLINRYPEIDYQVLTYIEHLQYQLPIYSLALGSKNPLAPTIALVGGVHGVERIGTRLLIAFLGSVLKRLEWDQGLQHELQNIRLLFCPLLNPAGMAQGQRCNNAGVDLMRNAPVNAKHRVTWMVGGHRLSNRLPWFRGINGSPMQPEASALCDWIRDEVLPAPFSMVLDCHSGFGLRDRIWFPLAGSRDPIHHSAEISALISLFESSYPHHNYIIEPQHHSYLTHGDLWDYLYHESLKNPDHVFLPLTLEMGSWSWVKKNPRQLVSFMGLFNPQVPHREKRTFRRHLILLEFLMRSCRSVTAWLPGTPLQRAKHEIAARQRWYG